jgi:hypothetical protein
VPPFLASLIYVRLIPLLKRKWEYLSLLVIVPICFAADSFGGGFLYLAYRHSSGTPNMAVLTVLAVLTAFTSYAMVMLAGRLIGLDKSRLITPQPVRPEAVEVP